MLYFFSFFFFSIPLILHLRNDQLEIFPTSEFTELKQAHVRPSKSLQQPKQKFIFCILWCGMATVCKRVFPLEWGRPCGKKKIKSLSKYANLKTGTLLIANIALLIIVCLPEGISGDLIWCHFNAQLKWSRSLKSRVQGCENVADSPHSEEMVTAGPPQCPVDRWHSRSGTRPFWARALTASPLSCLNVTHQQILIRGVTPWRVFVCFFCAWVIGWLYHLFAICN